MPSGLGLGLLIMPASILLMIRRDQGPVARYLRAGAVSAATARRPGTLGIGRLFLLRDAERRGILVATGDGRYFVDTGAYRRRRRRTVTRAIAIAVMLAAAGAWLLLR